MPRAVTRKIKRAPETAAEVSLRERVCDRLRFVQEAWNIPSSEFARRIGLTPSQYSNIKNRRNIPSHAVLAAAMREFHLKADWFYQGADDQVANRFDQPSIKQRSSDCAEPD